jgi:hypothetical protein
VIIEKVRPNMKRQVPGRLFASALAFYVYASSLYSTESLIYALAAGGGGPALACMNVLAALALAGALDTVVNDCLPDRWRWACGVRYRQVLWMLLAVTYTGLAWVSMREPWGGWLAGYYLICGAHCVSVSYVDLWQEYGERHRRRCIADREKRHA